MRKSLFIVQIEAAFLRAVALENGRKASQKVGKSWESNKGGGKIIKSYKTILRISLFKAESQRLSKLFTCIRRL